MGLQTALFYLFQTCREWSILIENTKLQILKYIHGEFHPKFVRGFTDAWKQVDYYVARYKDVLTHNELVEDIMSRFPGFFSCASLAHAYISVKH